MGGIGELHLNKKEAQDTAQDHEIDVAHSVVHGEGAHKAENEDQRREDDAGDGGYLGKDTGYRQSRTGP